MDPSDCVSVDTRRREMVAYGVAIVSSGLAGCTSALEGDDESDDTDNGETESQETDGDTDNGGEGTQETDHNTDNDEKVTEEIDLPDTDPSQSAFDAFDAWGSANQYDSILSDHDEKFHPDSPLLEYFAEDPEREPVRMVPLEHETITTVEDAHELNEDLPEGVELPDTEGSIGAAVVTVDLEIEEDTVRFTTLLLVSEQSWTVFEIIGEEELAEPAPDDAGRYVSLLVDDGDDANLIFEPADDHVDWLIATKDGTSMIVFDPEGNPRYNTEALTTWAEALAIVNQGEEPISTLTASFSARNTIDDEAHEAALSLLVDGTDADENDLLTLAGKERLRPGDSVIVGLELNLMDTGINDLDPDGDFELVFTPTN